MSHVGVVVVTHGPSAEDLVASAARLAGPLEAVRAVCVAATDAVERIAERVAWEAEQVDGGAGVLFLVDLPGSTPANVCLGEAAGRPGSVVLFGVNLPMLLKLETADRTCPPQVLAEQLETTAVRSIFRR